MSSSISSLTFADGSSYHGQVSSTSPSSSSPSASPLPHGFGIMRTKGFEMCGYFIRGKACGPGRFTAPNGDRFYGRWNSDNKRHGAGLFVSSDHAKQLVELYTSGKLTKRLKRRSPRATSLHWRLPSLTPCPATSSHTATLTADGSMLLLLTPSPSSSSLELHILDLASHEWLTPAVQGDAPPALASHTATLVGDDLYVIGGRDGLLVSSSVYVFHIPSGTWSCVLTKGVHLADHTATLVGDEIFCIVASSVFILSLDTLTWSQPDTDTSALGRAHKSFAVEAHSAVALHHRIYIFGGRLVTKSSDYDRCSSRLLVFNTATLAWELPSLDGPPPPKQTDFSGIPVPSYKLPRCEHTATLVDNRYMYIIGGLTTSNPEINEVHTSYLDDVQCLDLDTLTWQATQPRFTFTPPLSLHSATYVPAHNGIYVIGGQNHAADALSELHVLNIPHEPEPTTAPTTAPTAPTTTPPEDPARLAAAIRDATPPPSSPPTASWKGDAANSSSSILSMFNNKD